MATDEPDIPQAGGDSFLTVAIAFVANLVIAIAKTGAAMLTGSVLWWPRPRTHGPTRATRSCC